MSDWRTDVSEGWKEKNHDSQIGEAHPGDAVNDSQRAKGCFNCGSEEHRKAECPEPPKPREFTGECRSCGETGHQARDCPTKVHLCKRCNTEGHETAHCEAEMRRLDHSKVEDKTVEEAWQLMQTASDEADVGDFRDALVVLSKAAPDLTYVDIERECRRRKLAIYLIGLEKELSPVFTNVDLQGKLDRKYTVAYFLSSKCPRPVLMDKWPKGDNLDRLANAGSPIESGATICRGCGEVGHNRRACPSPTDRAVEERTCPLCSGAHALRDCKEPRQKERKPRTCKICDQEDHIAADCPSKPALTCRNCGEEGHMSKDCSKERVVRCMNCEEEGHLMRDCTQQIDWSKMKCRHCGELGHLSQARCKTNENCGVPEEAIGEARSHGGGAAVANSQGDTWNDQADSQSGWVKGTPTTVTARGW